MPTQRWFYESRFEGLIRFAEGGGIVLATYPSFWKTEAGEKVIDRRLFSLFWVDSKVLDRKVAGTMIFRPSTEAWLFEDLPTEISSDHWGWIITSTKGITEGEWRISNAYEWLSHDNPNSLDPDLSGRSSNLCLMRKWDSGGLFVYTCFHYGLSFKDDPRLGKLMDNMINRSPTTVGANLSFSERRFKSFEKQVQVYRVLLVVAVLIIGLLLSRFFFPASDFSDIAKSIVLTLFSELITYIITNTVGK